MALLQRALQRGPGPTADVDDVRMSILEHLEALRRALIISLLGWAGCTAVAFAFWGRIADFLIHRARLDHLVFTTPTGAVGLGLKIAMVVGVALSAPIWIQQTWWFVSPGLHRHERRLIGPLVIATVAFFAIGIGFALFALPLFMTVLRGFAPRDLSYLPVGEDFINFVLFLVLGFGLVFEMPVIVFVLGLMRIVSTSWLYANRFYWVIGLGILSNLMTPGVDVITPLFMWVPLWVLWEATALLLKVMGR